MLFSALASYSNPFSIHPINVKILKKFKLITCNLLLWPILLQKTHIAIAKQIGKELKLKEKETKLLEIGSTTPDSWGDFPHHTRKDNEILKRIANSRNMFLAGDDECYSELGIGLHYLQDRWTLRPRTADTHTRWEIAIAQSPLLDDLHLIENLKQSDLPIKAIDEYTKLYNLLIRIKNNGIQSVYDFSYAYWKKLDGISTSLTMLKFEADSRKREERVDALIEEEYLKPGIEGCQAALIQFILTNRPSSWSNPILDLNIAYRMSLEVARYTLIAVKQLGKEDPWNIKSHSENEKHVGLVEKLGFLALSQFELIPRPTVAEKKMRKEYFDRAKAEREQQKLEDEKKRLQSEKEQLERRRQARLEQLEFEEKQLEIKEMRKKKLAGEMAIIAFFLGWILFGLPIGTIFFMEGNLILGGLISLGIGLIAAIIAYFIETRLELVLKI